MVYVNKMRCETFFKIVTLKKTEFNKRPVERSKRSIN